MDARSLEEERMNEGIPPQDDKVEKVSQHCKVSKVLKVHKFLPRLSLS